MLYSPQLHATNLFRRGPSVRKVPPVEKTTKKKKKERERTEETSEEGTNEGAQAFINNMNVG